MSAPYNLTCGIVIRGRPVGKTSTPEQIIKIVNPGNKIVNRYLIAPFSVLGSMNDLNFQIKSMIRVSGGLTDADLSEINRHLNRIPMGAIKYKVGIDELKQRLADAYE